MTVLTFLCYLVDNVWENKNYKNDIHSAGDFNKGFKEIKELYKDICNFQQEKKCLEELVWDKHTGDLIRYVDLGNTKLNIAALGKQKKFIHMFSRSIEVWSSPTFLQKFLLPPSFFLCIAISVSAY